jgi:hypothetical protein
MTHHDAPLTCAEFEALVPDLLDGPIAAGDRDRMDAHRKGCRACDALATDLTGIKHQAARLGTLTPTRDLWDGEGGIASRIEAEVVQFPITPAPGEVLAVRPASTAVSQLRTRNSRLVLLAAASVLVAVTAGVTWMVATRNAPATDVAVADSGFAAAMEGTRNLRVASRPAMNESYEGEIATLRRIVDERRAELDSATVAVLERNLQVIDRAIAESKAALAASPQSAFLIDRLADAYDTKLRTLRAVATMPAGGD